MHHSVEVKSKNNGLAIVGQDIVEDSIINLGYRQRTNGLRNGLLDFVRLKIDVDGPKVMLSA